MPDAEEIQALHRGIGIMPKSNFSSITMSESMYDRLQAMYDKHKEDKTVKPGVCSLSGFFIDKFTLHMEEKKSLIKLANKITKIPEKFTESKLTIKKGLHDDIQMFYDKPLNE